MLLSIPFNLFYTHYAALLSLLQFVGIITYALLCGASLILMDLSNRRINAVFAALYLLIIVVELMHPIFFAYRATVYWWILMFGALLTSIFKAKNN